MRLYFKQSPNQIPAVTQLGCKHIMFLFGHDFHLILLTEKVLLGCFQIAIKLWRYERQKIDNYTKFRSYIWKGAFTAFKVTFCPLSHLTCFMLVFMSLNILLQLFCSTNHTINISVRSFDMCFKAFCIREYLHTSRFIANNFHVFQFNCNKNLV